MASIGSVRRCADDGKVSGLAAGLAHSWNVDPVLVRVAFAILALSGGIGVLLYLAGWVMIPLEGRDTSHLDEAIPQTRRWPKEARIAIVAAVCLVGAGVLSSLAPFSLVAGMVLAAVWYFGHYKNRRHRPRRPRSEHGNPHVAPSAGESTEPQQRTQFFDYSGERTPFTRAAAAWQQRIISEQRVAADAYRVEQARSGDQREPAYAPSSTGYPPAPSPSIDEQRAAFLADPDPVGLYSPPVDDEAIAEVDLVADRKLARRRSSRRLGLLALVVFGLTMTGLGVASALGATIGAATYLAATLLVIGLSLIAGTRYGRPPAMVFAAVVVSLALLCSLFVSNGPVGELRYKEVRAINAAELATPAEIRSGHLSVDLRDLQLDEPQSYSASVGTGRLEVFLPEDVPVRITGSVHNGLLTIYGQEDEWGSRLEYTQPPPTDQPGPVLTLDLDVHRGQLEVQR